MLKVFIVKNTVLGKEWLEIFGKFLLQCSAYLKSGQTSMIQLFWEKTNKQKILTVFTKKHHQTVINV